MITLTPVDETSHAQVWDRLQDHDGDVRFTTDGALGGYHLSVKTIGQDIITMLVAVIGSRRPLTTMMAKSTSTCWTTVVGPTIWVC